MFLGGFSIKAHRLIGSAVSVGMHYNSAATADVQMSQRARVTLSGTTLSFFFLSVTFCILQVLFQGFLWNSDSTAFNTLNGILENTDVPTSLLRWLSVNRADYHLRLCTEAPIGVQNISHICPTIYDSTLMSQPSNWTAPRNIRKHVCTILICGVTQELKQFVGFPSQR